MSHAIHVLAAFFAAINRHDLPAMSQDFAPDILRVEPTGHATAGTYRGIEEVRNHLAQGRGTWADGTCTPEKFIEQGDTVVVYLHAHVRLIGATNWIDGRFADGFVVRDGKITEYRTFWQRADALKWAGLTDDAPA